MQTALRPYTTAGVALLGAGVIAITPIAPRMPDITDIERALPVHLTAAVDPITQWTDVLNQANANFTTIANNFLAKPFPVLQQVIANQIGYLGELRSCSPAVRPDSSRLRTRLDGPPRGPGLR